MKKLLIAVFALTSLSVFADGHSANMVRFYGWGNGNYPESFGVEMVSDDADNKNTTTTMSINYARAFGQWQVGLAYVSVAGESGGSDIGGNSIGLSGYYNFDAAIDKSWYVGLHYFMHTATDGGYTAQYSDDALGEDDKSTSIVLELGKRFHIGKGLGMFNLTFAPEVHYAMTSYEWDNEANDDSNGKAYTELSWHLLKFDLLF